jgi:hypothetical protein
MPPGSWVIGDQSLRETLAEIKQAQHCPEQAIQRVVPQIAFECVFHRTALDPGPVLPRTAAVDHDINDLLRGKIDDRVEIY